MEDPSITSIGSFDVPSAHRAFTYLAMSSHPLPSTVAPLGPLNDWDLEQFWTAFYGGVAGKYEIEPLWEMDGGSVVDIPAKLLEKNHTYRVRARVQDTHGHWSHWSDPSQFTIATPR